MRKGFLPGKFSNSLGLMWSELNSPVKRLSWMCLLSISVCDSGTIA